jgi:ElaB/YqjD/DUF883 family membrane-anchored ribosome-binding protein
MEMFPAAPASRSHELVGWCVELSASLFVLFVDERGDSDSPSNENTREDAMADLKKRTDNLSDELADAAQSIYSQTADSASRVYAQTAVSVSRVADATGKAARSTAGSMEKALRSTIEHQPYTSVAVALGLGWLLGRTHRPL